MLGVLRVIVESKILSLEYFASSLCLLSCQPVHRYTRCTEKILCVVPRYHATQTTYCCTLMYRHIHTYYILHTTYYILLFIHECSAGFISKPANRKNYLFSRPSQMLICSLRYMYIQIQGEQDNVYFNSFMYFH